MQKYLKAVSNEHYEYDWNYIWSIPEFSLLKTTYQNPRWHGEGSVAKHTEMVCEEILKIVNTAAGFTPWKRKTLMLAALFHDIGKGVTTEIGKDGNLHSYDHEVAGAKITRQMLWNDLTPLMREEVVFLVRHHMEPLTWKASKNPREKYEKLNKKAPVETSDMEMLMCLKYADLVGSEQEDTVGRQNDLTFIGSFITLPASDNLKHKSVCCYIMVGLPGSGKSTKAKEIAEKNDAVIISRDDIRVELGFCKADEKYLGSQEEENLVTDMFNSRLINNVKANKNVVIDNTNLKRKYRDGYKELLLKYPYVKYVIYYVEAKTLDLNIQRRQGLLNKDVLLLMRDKMEFPSGDEGRVLVCQNDNNGDLK